MKNKSHKLIFKSFLNINIPLALKESEYVNDLIALDSLVAGYCSTLLHSKKKVIIFECPLITKEQKNIFGNLINSTNEKNKSDLVIYFRLLLLVEAILNQYNNM